MLRLQVIWNIMQTYLPRGRWLAIDEIYNVVRANAALDPEDMQPAAPGSTDPKWKRNVRNVLQHQKGTEFLEWERPAQYRLPEERNDRLRQLIIRDMDALQVEELPLLDVSGTEGNRIRRYTNHYERDRTLRTAAVQLHGTTCQGCGFDFESFYGPLGSDFIEVHHVKPISTLGGTSLVNPRTDMICLCPNCHRMVHRNPDHILTLEELRTIITQYGWASRT